MSNYKKWDNPNELAPSIELGQYLHDIRTRHIGITQKIVSENAGVPRCKLSRWENGLKIPSYDNITKLAGYYRDQRIISHPEYYAILQLHDDTVRKIGLTNVKNMKKNCN